VIGMAAAQFDVVHSFATYDVRVDTGELSPEGSGRRGPSLTQKSAISGPDGVDDGDESGSVPHSWRLR
jgi:hypothetical protein